MLDGNIGKNMQKLPHGKSAASEVKQGSETNNRGDLGMQKIEEARLSLKPPSSSMPQNKEQKVSLDKRFKRC